jgi:hypothetical protein
MTAVATITGYAMLFKQHGGLCIDTDCHRLGGLFSDQKLLALLALNPERLATATIPRRTRLRILILR